MKYAFRGKKIMKKIVKKRVTKESNKGNTNERQRKNGVKL